MLSALAFLNLGASEILFILVLALVLFGADKAPQIARTLGKARAQLEQAKGQIADAIKGDDERAWDQQLAFEKERERKMIEADPDHQALERAAEGLGLQTQGLSDAELKAAIRAKLGAGPEGSGEKAADARQ